MIRTMLPTEAKLVVSSKIYISTSVSILTKILINI